MGTTKAWITTHETAERTMTHDFGHGVKIILDWQNEKIVKTKDREIVMQCDMKDYDIAGYETLLINTEKEVLK